jgi:Raf kinase inhibitor-like YbhB/YbcL family protein
MENAMKIAPFALLALLVATPAVAGSEAGLATAQLAAPATLKIASPQFAAGGRIPLQASAYGANVSPALTWPAPPRGTQSLALIVEDPDASPDKPFVHWVVYGMPATARGMTAGATPPGSADGTNGTGKTGYHGPHPPPNGDHHYHFQLFALDQKPPLRPGADRDALVAAMRGHVLAKGDLVGLFRKP